MLSVHQPRSDAYELFSRLVVLAQGSVVYSGRTAGCLAYFAERGLCAAPRTNPLDFVVDIASVDARDEAAEIESRARVRWLVQCWKDHEREGGHSGGNDEVVAAAAATDPEKETSTTKAHLSYPDPAAPGSPLLTGTATSSQTSTMRPSVLAQTGILLSRSTKNMARAYPELAGHILQALVLGLLMGITYFRLGGAPNDVQSLKTLAFQVVPVYGYMSQVVWTFKWCTDLVVFDREREDGLYAAAAWVTAEVGAWMPVNVGAPVLYAVLVYFVCGMRTDDLAYYFWVFVLDLVLVQMCLVAWSLLAGSIEVRLLCCPCTITTYVLTPGHSAASHGHRSWVTRLRSSSSSPPASSSSTSPVGFAGSAGSPRISSPSGSSSSPSSVTARLRVSASTTTTLLVRNAMARTCCGASRLTRMSRSGRCSWGWWGSGSSCSSWQRSS